MLFDKNDFSASSISAGVLANLVGYSSSAIIVFQAALKFGLSPIEASTWLGVLCLAMGILTITLSQRYKTPIMFAWSTAGAILILSGQHLTLNEAIAAFLFSGLLIFLSGITGLFEKFYKKIPTSLAQAMLAGILLKFTLNVFGQMKDHLSFVFILFLAYLICRRMAPRYSVLVAAFIGLPLSLLYGNLNLAEFHFQLAIPQYHSPTFSWPAIISLGIPLYIVTMTSQNMAGIATLHSYNYNINISKTLTWSGLANMLIAPFGGFSLNLAAITAAICMGEEAHPQHSKRYTAAITSGIIYLLMGIFCGAVGNFFHILPKELIVTITGLALFGTVTQGLVGSLNNINEREAAMITFFVTASDVTIFDIGSAFYGILLGTFTFIILNIKKNKIDLA